jgi:hypothetical protein
MCQSTDCIWILCDGNHLTHQDGKGDFKKNMKKLLILMLTLTTLVGCGTIQKKNNSLESISQVTANIATAQAKALSHTNVVLATTYNQQIQAINGKPSDVKSTNFDVAVSQVINDKYVIDKSLEKELTDTKAQLKEYRSWFGLKGVWLSLKQFSHWVIGSTLALTALVVLMRIFASSSPIISGIWSVISNILGWFINQFALICPKLLDSIKNTESEVVGDWKKLWNWVTGAFVKKPVVPPTP